MEITTIDISEQLMLTTIEVHHTMSNVYIIYIYICMNVIRRRERERERKMNYM